MESFFIQKKEEDIEYVRGLYCHVMSEYLERYRLVAEPTIQTHTFLFLFSLSLSVTCFHGTSGGGILYRHEETKDIKKTGATEKEKKENINLFSFLLTNKKYILLFLHSTCAALWCGAGGNNLTKNNINSSILRRHEVSNPEAVCIDGSRAIYYTDAAEYLFF